VGYSPFGHGSFPRPASTAGRTLADIAGDHGGTARQVALAFLTRWPSLLAIPKAAKPANVTDNAAADDLFLSEAELSRIDAAFPLGKAPRSLPII
jgi:diketogulonate reductase-like aldo/keto reductase